MFFVEMLFVYLTMSPSFPETVFMTNGNAFRLSGEYKTYPTALQFRDHKDQLFVIQYRRIDFGRTFAPPKRPPPPKPEYQPRRDIPWEHPHYRDKTRVFYSIEITSKDLASWSIRKPKIVPITRIDESVEDPPDEESLGEGG